MKLFVWDFHGVLEKGNDEAVLEITNLVLKEQGHSRRMTREEGHFLAGLRWHEYFAFLLPHLTQPDFFELQSQCLNVSLHNPDIIAQHIQLNDHAHDVLKTIKNSSHTQILISNTPPKSLEVFVKITGIEPYFPPSHRFGVDSHSQSNFTKKDCLEGFIKHKHFPNGIISIGDSPGDMALIYNRPNGKGYLYSHPGRSHRTIECHHKISDLREILKEL